MRKIFPIVFILVSCSDIVLEDVPACITDRISDTTIRVDEYFYDGQRVYSIENPPVCCDQLFYIINYNCEEVCAPSGGLGGNGDGRCPNFNDEAVFLRTIWPSAD